MIRFKTVFWLFVVGFIAVTYRLFTIQLLNTEKTIPIEKFIKTEKKSSLRGEIYDTKGQPLVLNKRTFDVYVDVVSLGENNDLKSDLKKYLALKNSTISAVLKKDNWQRIADNIEESKKAELLKYYPKYLNFEEQWLRHYPEGSMSAHLLGFLGKDDLGQPKGYIGVEGYFNQELEGMPSFQEKEEDFIGIPFIGSLVKEDQVYAGLDLYTSLDTNIQNMMEQELYKGLYKYKAKNACAIIADPYSGSIKAMGCVPGFVPENYYKYETYDFVNLLVSSVYEPGSTFKPLVVAMALEEKKIKKNTVFEEKGPYIIGEYAIQTWDNKYRDTINVQKILEKSSNVGMVKIINRLNKNTIEKYLKKLGLRELTGIELEGEVNSLINNYKDWRPIDIATLSFGQGMAVTPIQLVQAFSAIANDGYLVKPSIVKNFYDPKTEQKIDTDNNIKHRVYSTKTTAVMKELLLKAVDNAEAYWPQKQDGYSICGKTGTAQIPIEGHYDQSKTIASFIGFAPCTKPKFIMLTLYYQPESSPWGSETAAPTFFNIANKLLLYYNIPPDRY
jgi:cell division protein FtsI/penicillin-binding protein 2